MDVYQSDLIEVLSIKDNLFILVNSMAFENDGCDMCEEAQAQLADVKKWMECSMVREINIAFTCITNNNVI